MTELFKLFNKILEYYGQTAASIILVVVVIIYGVFLINKNYSSLIKAYLEKKIKEKDKLHTKATHHRKMITPKIRKELSALAHELNMDRATLIEFSNGSSNLVGLPFLYLSSTCEVVAPGINAIAHRFQKINISLFAEELEGLENKGYFYLENIEEVKESSQIVYAMLKKNKVRSILLYVVQGVDDIIGFIALSKTGEGSFTRDEALPKTALAAQVISSYLNFDALQQEL